jgi:hypothetical protein
MLSSTPASHSIRPGRVTIDSPDQLPRRCPPLPALQFGYSIKRRASLPDETTLRERGHATKRSRFDSTPHLPGVPLEATPTVTQGVDLPPCTKAIMQSQSNGRRSNSPASHHSASRTPSPSMSPRNMQPSLSSRNTASASPPTQRSPPTLPLPRQMKRPNPKRLVLSLSLPPTPIDTPGGFESTDNTPFTPGPPKTPALAMSLGRASTKGFRRPSLLSVVTQTDVPSHGRVRASTTIDPTYQRSDQGWKTALPRRGFSAMSEGLSSSPTSTSISEASTSTTPFSSPQRRSTEPHFGGPYGKGPIQVIPFVYLGAEDSVWDRRWRGDGKRCRVLNVAQELENPWARNDADMERARFGKYDLDDGAVEYGHLRWSHGESGLADCRGAGGGRWGFWRAINWMEEARRGGIPVLIQ